MEIGFSFIDLAPGGAQQLLVQLAVELTHHGHQIKYRILADPQDPLHVDPHLLRLLQQAGRPVSNISGFRGCQVVQMDGYHSLRHKIPYLLSIKKWAETFHSRYSVSRSGPVYAPYRVAVSKYIQSLLPHPTAVIPNGIRLPALFKDELKEYDVAILGRIHPVKRQDFFFNICQELIKKRHQLSCLLIGGFSCDRHYQDVILNQIASLASQQMKIEITGFIPHDKVFTYLSKTKILIIPSQDEGFGRMAIEALACGVPIVSNPVGGLLEIIDHGIDGYFTDLDQLESFVQFSDFLLGNPSLCQEMGKKGRQKVESKFTIESITASYLELYKRISMSRI
jgi:glycosyltransferase involved in cell wall biosynthesis